MRINFHVAVSLIAQVTAAMNRISSANLLIYSNCVLTLFIQILCVGEQKQVPMGERVDVGESERGSKTGGETLKLRMVDFDKRQSHVFDKILHGC